MIFSHKRKRKARSFRKELGKEREHGIIFNRKLCDNILVHIKNKGEIMIVLDSEGKRVKQGLIQGLCLDLTKPQCICAVGGGGKTTLVKELALELSKQQKKVICLTTTKILKPDYGTMIEEESMELVEQAEGIVTVALPWKNGKMTGVSEEFQRQLLTKYPLVLIEADGSKGLPTKVPNDTEPVIPKEATLVLGIQGIDALYHPIKQVCHRKELVCKFLQKNERDLLTLEDMVRIYSSAQALQKNIGKAYFVPIIQKVDTKERKEQAMKLSHLLKDKGMNQVLITGRSMEESDESSY